MSNLSMLEKIQIRLLQSNVFYASLLSQMRKIEVTGEMAKAIPTEAVAIKNGRMELYWNPKFLESLTLDEAKGVLEHELLHVVLAHLTRMREEYKENGQLANIAQDMCCNQLIEKLPKGCAKVENFPADWGLKLNDTAEHYYDLMKKHANKMSVESDGKGGFDIVIKDGKGNEIGRMKVKTPDCHEPWQDSDSDIPELAKEVIRQAVKEAYDQHQKQKGTLPSGVEELIQEWLTPPQVSWRTLLKKFVAASIKSGHKNSWKRPNRRFGEVQKGKLADRQIVITVVIDTSGSISPDDFSAFMSEIRSIQSCYKGTITVLECDADVQKEYKLTKYAKPQLNFKGRGGTSFVPPFEYVKEKKIKTDVLIYFTDLYGDFPTKRPPYPTIWVSTTDQTKVPFGYCISIVNNPDKKKGR